MKHAALAAKDIAAFATTAKVGLIATANGEGLPHLTLITTIQAKTPTKLMFGKFSEGLSKKHLLSRPKLGWLQLTMDKRLWRGKAEYTHFLKEGEDYVAMNELPMFRYNTYFGINTVYYLNLVESGGEEALPMSRIVPGAVMAMLAKGGAGTGNKEPILNPFSLNLFAKKDNLRFLGRIGDDDYPEIIPLLTCQPADSRRLIFSPFAYSDELRTLREGEHVAVYAMSMNMENVLVRGVFQGYRRVRGFKVGVIDLDWVYNSMPPCHGQIYPPQALTPVRHF